MLNDICLQSEFMLLSLQFEGSKVTIQNAETGAGFQQWLLWTIFVGYTLCWDRS